MEDEDYGEDERRGNAQAIIEMAERLAACEHIDDLSDGEVLVVPKGMDVHPVGPLVEHLRERPLRRKGTANLGRLGSFIAHANRFKSGESVIFAHEAHPSLTSVLDYHPAGADSEPRFGEHRGVYRFPVSPEWKAWTELPTMSQADFAELLEDRIGDILDPNAAGATVRDFAEHLGFTLASPAQLMTLSRGLSVRVDQRVASHVKLSSGEAKVVYEEQHGDEAGGPLKVPGGFVLAIPVFEGEALYQVGARLRYRVRGGAVFWTVVLHRSDLIFRHAFDEACDKAHEDTGLPVFHGTPE